MKPPIKYYYKKVTTDTNGKKIFLEDWLPLENEEAYNKVCEVEQKIIDREKVDEWHRPFKLYSDGSIELFKPKRK